MSCRPLPPPPPPPTHTHILPKHNGLNNAALVACVGWWSIIVLEYGMNVGSRSAAVIRECIYTCTQSMVTSLYLQGNDDIFWNFELNVHKGGIWVPLKTLVPQISSCKSHNTRASLAIVKPSRCSTQDYSMQPYKTLIGHTNYHRAINITMLP